MRSEDSHGGTAVPVLLGRDHELRMLDELLDRGREHGAGLLVRGEAGIGKSSLLSATAVAARSRGYQVLSTVGVEAESHMANAALHRLLAPLLTMADRLPRPQRAALLGAFGMDEAAAPRPFLIGLATLNLLSEAAAAAPVLVLADDAQWLDGETCAVLAFVARRLEGDPLVLVAGVRQGYDTPLDEAGLPDLELGALAAGDASALLDAGAPGLAPEARARVLAAAAGNPLALVELPAAMPVSGGEGPEAPGTLPMTARLERSFAARLHLLTPPTRRLLLLAALNDSDDLGEVISAAAAGPDVARLDDLEPALAARLVSLEGTHLRFRHPLIRSAVVTVAGELARRSAHATLAQAMVGQPERRAWHRALATPNPDEDVATEVEAAAAAARNRGGIQAAIRAQEQAARLTPDARRRASRLLRAAEMAFEGGSAAVVGRLLQQAQAVGLTGAEARRATWVRELFDDGIPGDAARTHLLVETADAARVDGDAGLWLNLMVSAAMHCWWADPGPAARAEVVAALSRGPDSSDPRALAVIALATPVAAASRVMEEIRRLGAFETLDPDALRLLAAAAIGVGDFEAAARIAALGADALRLQGRVSLLVHTLVVRAHAALETGDLETAVTAAEEGRRLAEETRQPVWLSAAMEAQAEVLGLRGDVAGAQALLADTGRVAVGRRLSTLMSVVEAARGKALLTAGRNADAYEHLRRAFEAVDDEHHPRQLYGSIGGLAEAAVQCGRRDEARALLAPVERAALVSPSPKLQVGVAHARALLAEDDDAEPLYLEAMALAGEHWRLDRARLELAYGAWLRRHRRARESRAPLRAAADTFEALGLTPWADRAHQELRASGETRMRRPTSWTALSPQELQIARMAAEGLSNAEIGERLFLSHRTVGSHLYRVFPKLGITARSQLRDALGELSPTGRSSQPTEATASAPG